MKRHFLLRNILKSIIPEKMLKVPLLEAGLAIHRDKAPENLKPFHQHMEETFQKLKTSIEEKYGKKSAPPELQDFRPVTVRRAKTAPPKTNVKRDRSSEVSNFSLESPRKSLPSSVSVSSTQSSKISPSLRGTIFVKQNSSSSKSSGRKSRESSTLTLRRSSGSSIANQNHEKQSQSQWYDNSPTTPKSDGPVIELSEPLTPQRPLRPEAEKRHSRPSSGQFHRRTPSPTRISQSPSSSLYSLSLPSTPSIITRVFAPGEQSEEKPPPLPQKQAYADYTNITEDLQFSSTSLRKNSLTLSLRTKNKPPPPLPVKENSANKNSLSPQDESSLPPVIPKRPEIKISDDITES